MICSYCGKEFKREAFCSPSHKVMFHRKLTNGKQVTKELTKSKQVNERLIEPEEDFEITDEVGETISVNAQCKHGNLRSLCKLCITGHR